MRHTDVIIRKTYEQNLKTFSRRNRARASRALYIYMREINGDGLRCEFDYGSSDVDHQLELPRKHRSEIKRLKAQVRQFKRFIKLLKKLGDRPAVQLNRRWWVTDGADETITRTLDPQAIPTYLAFHAALVAYLGALSKRKPDWDKIDELARRVAYMVNPEEWREAGAPASGHRVTEFGTRLFLEAILAKPKEPIGWLSRHY